VEDTETARAWMTARRGVAKERLGVVGFSLGGGTAMATAARHPEWFRCLVLWSSVTGDLHEAFTSWSIVREQGVEAKAEKEGVAALEIAGWKTVTLRREFFASLRGVDLDAALAVYPGAVLSVRGTEDFLPVREAELLKIAKGRPAEAVLIAGADHVFNVFTPGAPQPGQARDSTVEWLARNL
jgi:pimeloyl-ACP methyl ester carboxylesterase